MVQIGSKPISEFFMDKHNEIIFITEFVEEERENLVRMYLDFNEKRRCCGLPPVKKEMIERWIDYLNKHGYMFIAKHRDRVIGHIAAVPENSSAEIAIFVHQDYEGRRIGSELIRFMKESIKKKNIKKLVAVTEETNRSSVKLHLALGFKIKEVKGGMITFEKEIE